MDGKGNITKDQFCKTCYLDWVVQLEINVKKKLKKNPSYWRVEKVDKEISNYIPSTIKRKMI